MAIDDPAQQNRPASRTLGVEPLRNAFRQPLVRAIALVQFVYIAALSLWLFGAFQSVELRLYDWLIQVRSAIDRAPPPPIVLVGADERDLDRFGWPLSDAVLAAVIEKLESLRPRTMGIDLYRPVPLPPGEDALRDAFVQHKNVLGTFKLAIGGETGIAPPSALKGTGRVGFADNIADPGGTLRRGLLFADDGVTGYTGFAASLAFMYLARDHIAPSFAGDVLTLGKARIHPFTGTDGGYVGADDHGYQILLDYRGGAHPFSMVPVRDVLDGRVAADLMQDKVVLVGVASESVKDFFFSPFSSGGGQGRLYGIEVHAQLVAQLLRMALAGDPQIEGLPRPVNALWTWICCVAGGITARYFRSPLVVAAVAAAGIMLLAGLSVVSFERALWLTLVPPGVGWLASIMLVTALMSQTEREQRDAIMQLFSRSVSEEIAQNLWDQRDAFMKGGRPQAQRLMATVLFTDMRDFTSISETIDAAALLEWLNTYMEEMASVVSRHGGIVDKFIGDAVMAVFGIPVARKDESEVAADARRAVDCALDMARSLERLNAAWSTRGAPVVAIRVGISTGPLVAGTLGGSARMNYTVVGDTVNTSARLESFDKDVGNDLGCRIIIGGPTHDLLGDDYLYRPVGEISLKGKAQMIPAYIVLARRNDPEVSEP
jgi:adenylate cyclase